VEVEGFCKTGYKRQFLNLYEEVLLINKVTLDSSTSVTWELSSCWDDTWYECNQIGPFHQTAFSKKCEDENPFDA